ncbi:uncharacterized protein [Dermacentor albipictus]|uniref:uncharacterized protein isoform X1 n=1 Tax=Dermacentor albipictus TaxID=60249 RepID=UPI0031FD8630
MALVSAAWPALLLTLLAPAASGHGHVFLLEAETTTADSQQNTSSVQPPVQPGNASSLVFPSCTTDAGCPGALMCVEGTCGCPFSRPVLILGGSGKQRLSPLCEPLRGVHEACVWSEQCAAADPGLDCRKGRCQCVGRPSPWGGVCRALDGMWSLPSWLPTTTARHNRLQHLLPLRLPISHFPLPVTLVYSREKMRRRRGHGSVCTNASAPITGSVTKPLIWASCFAVIALIVAGLMFCFAQPPNRHNSACFSESCLLSPSTGSVLNNLAAQRLLFSRRKTDSAGDSRRTSVGSSVRRGSAPREGAHCTGARNLSAASSCKAPPPLPRGFLSCHGLQQPLDDPRGDLGRSSCSLTAEGASWPPVVLLDRSETSLELQVISLDTLNAPLASVHSLRRASAPALVLSPCRSQADASQAVASSPHVRSEGGEPAAAPPAVAQSVGHDWASKLGEQLANDSYGFTLDISQSSLPAVLSTVSGAVDAEQRRASRQSRLRRNISESLRRELADAWRCSGTLPSSRLLLQPPVFISPDHISSAAESPGSD